MGGVIEDVLYFSRRRRQPLCPLSVLQWRWYVESELQLAWQWLGRQQPCGLARNSLHFSLYILSGEFCFVSCPFHPPSIFPISLTFSERAMYFLLSKDLVSHNIIRNIFNVSVFLIANFTYGCFSSRRKKLAIARASIISVSKIFIFCPKVYRCAFGGRWFFRRN